MTDREKILELARTVYDTDFSEAAEERLIRFVALIEAEMGGEPVAYIGTDGNLGWLKKPTVVYSKAVPLYMMRTTATEQEV